MKTPYMVLRIEDPQGLQDEIRQKMDEFLDVYSFYLSTRLAWARDEVKLKAYEIHLLDPTFNFQI